MDIKQLLAEANSKYEALEAKYAEISELVTGLKATGENIADNEAFKTLQNELADLEEKVKRGVHTPDNSGKSIRDYTTLIVGKFMKQAHIEKNLGGVATEKGFDTFVAAEIKSLNLTNPGEGAESVAEILSRQIIERAREAYPILGEIGRRQMPRDLREEVLISYPSVQEGIENVAGTAIPETTTQRYGEVKNRICKLNAKPRITDEALYGSDLDLYGQLMRLLDEEIGRYLLLQCLYGNGQDKNMRGILSSNRLSKVEGVKPTIDEANPADARNLDFYPIYFTGVDGSLPVGSIAIADWLIDFITELPTQYLQGAKFYMTRKTSKIFRKVRDTEGNKLLTKSDAGKGIELEGYPVVLDDNMPEMGSDAPFMIFGNLPMAFTISDGDIKKMLLDPYTVDGNLVVKIDQEYFEMVGKNDAIIVAMAAAS